LGYFIYWGTSATGDPTMVVDSPGFNPGPIPSGSTYYLRVKTGDRAGNVSAAVTLFTLKYDATATPPPNAPMGVSASDGTYTDKVRVTWNAAAGATGYELWRHNFSSNWLAGVISRAVSF
jgi:hypothetical protein